MIGTVMRLGLMAGALSAVLLPAGRAAAAIAGADFLSKVDTNGDKTISMKELDVYAGRRYDLIAKQSGGSVTSLQLGGRIPVKDFQAARGKSHDPNPDALSRAEFVGYAEKLFIEANTQVKKGSSPADGTLDLDELNTSAGKKLIELLE